MKNINFITKAISLVLTVGVLLVYSGFAAKHSSSLKAHEQAVAEIEAHNAEVLRKLNEAPAGKYKDGEYEGSARGFRSDIKVKVTVDGEEYDTQTISSYKESGWGNPVAVQIGMQASEKDYVVEISMDKGCETDHAQILAIAHN